MEDKSDKVAPSSLLPAVKVVNNSSVGKGSEEKARGSLLGDKIRSRGLSRSSLKSLGEDESSWEPLRNNRDYLVLLDLLISGSRDEIGIFFQKLSRLPMINRVDEVGLSPMHLTAMLGRNYVLAALIQWGGNVNLIGKGQKSPLHLACAEGHYEGVEILMENKADIFHADESGYTGLHYAAEGGHTDICKLLIMAGADVLAKDNCGGQTPLHLACLLGHPSCVEILLDGGADMNQENDWGQPPHNVLQSVGREKVLQISFIMDRFRGGSRAPSMVFQR
mmetsp:Transcript_11804/g.15417  ORF Transcript_11804/g.15417 Transcript_11804/m.15417 type:complete len:278 (+) Transcript_11804:138-971(+)